MTRRRSTERATGPAGIILVMAVLLTALLLVSACGGGSSSSTTSQPGQPTGGATQIAMKNIKFTPADVTIKVGQTVTWTNEDGTQHDVVANDGTFKSDLLNKGQTFSFTFTKAGTFPFYCSIHPQMKGTITVQ